LSPTPSPTGPVGPCSVTYSTNDWSNGFTGSLTIRNTGTAAWSSWTVAFTFPAGQRITQGWGARWTQSGAAVTGVNESWNGAVPAGGQLSVGFNASHPGTNPRPTGFTVNGAACTVAA
jgi:cellulase/cellobiase CelA1